MFAFLKKKTAYICLGKNLVCEVNSNFETLRYHSWFQKWTRNGKTAGLSGTFEHTLLYWHRKILGNVKLDKNIWGVWIILGNLKLLKRIFSYILILDRFKLSNKYIQLIHPINTSLKYVLDIDWVYSKKKKQRSCISENLPIIKLIFCEPNKIASS